MYYKTTVKSIHGCWYVTLNVQICYPVSTRYVLSGVYCMLRFSLFTQGIHSAHVSTNKDGMIYVTGETNRILTSTSGGRMLNAVFREFLRYNGNPLCVTMAPTGARATLPRVPLKVHLGWVGCNVWGPLNAREPTRRLFGGNVFP